MNRQWIAFISVGSFALVSAFAQEADTGGGSLLTPGGATSIQLPSATGTVGPSTTLPETTTGATGVNAPAPEPAAPINVPAAYGEAPVTLTPGQGRFAKPPLQFGISILQGYDDNVFSAPKKTQPAPTPFPTPTPSEQTITIPATIGNPPGFNRSGSIKLRATSPELQTTDFGTFTPTPKIGSAVTNASVSVRSQIATPRTALKADLNIGALYYWNRPGDALDYNDSFNLVFYHKLTPRLSVSTSANIAYQSQADFSRINAPTTSTAGNYLVGTTKIDLSYQWTARLSSVSSYTLNGIYFENENAQVNNLYENTLGTEIRFLLSPKTVALVEFRASAATHPNFTALDSTSQFFLLGFDTSFSPRLRASVRGGEQIREFKMADQNSQSSPYFESTLSYVYGHQSQLSWTNRFGLEESNSVSSQRVSLRTGIGINHVFTARTIGSLSLNYNRLSTTDTTSTSSEAIVENDVSCTLGLRYVYNQHLSLTLSYTYIETFSESEFNDYRRNQIFFGGEYSF